MAPARPLVRGFTLVELALVIVIIGLLAGGILIGRDLLRAAEMRKTYRQFEEIVAAVNAFHAKYNCLPGDCPTATEVFGAYDTSYACPPDNSSVGTATCDGDGNGEVEATNSLGDHEVFIFWQHLADAGLINGMFSGAASTTAGGTFLTEPGVNCPVLAAASNNCFSMGFGTGMDGCATAPSEGGDIRGNCLFMWPRGGDISTVQTGQGFVFSPTESFGYDAKYDDGLPTSGRLRNESSVPCGSWSDPRPDRVCGIVHIPGF